MRLGNLAKLENTQHAIQLYLFYTVHASCFIVECRFMYSSWCKFAGIVKCMHTANQGCRLFERSHSSLQFPSVSLCV